VGPREDIFVATAGEGADFECRIVDAEKRAGACVEADAEIAVIVFGQATGGVQADFIEHAAKVHEAADEGVFTA